MTRYKILVAIAMVAAVGCTSGPLKDGSLAVASKRDATADVGSAHSIALVDYEEPVARELTQPPSVEPLPGSQVELVTPQILPSADGLTMENLEQMALANSPAIGQATARIRALRGKWVQVGLLPNPIAGYVGSEIGNEGAGGQQGAFVGQTFITAHKLQRNRGIVAAEIDRAEQQLAAMQRRVQTDLRQGYYLALLAQRRLELANELVHITTEAVAASKALVEAEEIPLAGLLQTEVQFQSAQVFLRTSQNGLTQAWRRLSAVVGGTELPVQPLAGDVSKLPESLDWQEQLARIQSESPEVATAMADVLRTRRALNRARVEAVPNLLTQVSVQYDDSTDDTIAGVQLGLPLPIWNRNQGGIRQAQAEVTEAARNVNRVELNLKSRLADAFRQYTDAHITAETYASGILTRAQQTVELVQRGYKQGETGYLDLLTAQRTYSQTNLAYLDALGSLWQSHVLIDGLLLNGSLAQQSN